MYALNSLEKGSVATQVNACGAADLVASLGNHTIRSGGQTAARSIALEAMDRVSTELFLGCRANSGVEAPEEKAD
jgi:hypothetical protein